VTGTVLSLVRRNFTGALLFTLLCLIGGAAYGWQESRSVEGVIEVLWIVGVLAVLEISLSFDNAVVNASVLGEMDAVWRKRFLTWGMVIAVFGARVAFPLAIVGIGAGLGPVEALRLSLTHPADYERSSAARMSALQVLAAPFWRWSALAFSSTTRKMFTGWAG
jgi:hypothetical protein